MLLVTLLAAGCQRSSTATPADSPATSAAPSQIAWTDCGGFFQCGTVKVPLDYAHPTAGTIAIALIRRPATDHANRIGSVLTNPGGPGASGIQYLKNAVDGLANLNRRFDLIGFDPRGVGQSSPVRCLDGPQEDVYLALDSVLDDPQEKQAAIDADKNYVAACEQRSGKLLPFMDSANTARDMDLIRAALGDAKLTYLGFSYGTYIGQMYAHLFPTHVRALSLDGVVDPTVSANDALLGQVVGFEQNIQAFLANCRSVSTCTYGRTGDPGAKLTALMGRLDTTPLDVGGRQLTRALAMTGVLAALYDQSYWTYLDQALTSVDKGDGRLLIALADSYNERDQYGRYSNLTDAFSAIYCLDHPVPTDVAVYDQLGSAFTKASPLFGPWAQYGNLICADWPVPPTEKVGPLPVNGAPPILLIGGTNDPATPYAEAQSVNRQISGSVLLTREGNGHTSYDSSVCAKAAEDDYLINLTLPAPGTVCKS
jgi:pimeloyl-ACP methyl ester carboxylesterase